jgi:hypothetical protein
MQLDVYQLKEFAGVKLKLGEHGGPYSAVF